MNNIFKGFLGTSKPRTTTQNLKASVFDTASIASLFHSGLDVSGDVGNTALLNTYKNSIYVYRAVKLIAETASSFPFQLLKVVNGGGDTEEVETSPALDILSTSPYIPCLLYTSPSPRD